MNSLNIARNPLCSNCDTYTTSRQLSQFTSNMRKTPNLAGSCFDNIHTYILKIAMKTADNYRDSRALAAHPT